MPVSSEHPSSLPLQLRDRLEREDYSEAACLAAIRGEKVPYALGFPVTRLCVIRGIRYHPGFATELWGLPGHAEFTRALNARSIMSNVIPDMTSPDHFPYCIWHPDLAAEATYRGLARRYPHMRYHVGRACAAAGYPDLYRELQLLPDVSIAEEARDNQKNGGAIFDEIMAQQTKYAVMDDYTRSINLDNQRAGACLNGDTAVRSRLEVKQKYCQPTEHLIVTDLFESAHDETHYFNITEDWDIDEYDSERLEDNTALVPLLYSPLPAHLPTVEKDLLILVAAYSGNIDRYARLRRPQMIPGEYSCVVRGIYHDTMFAKWWCLQPELASSEQQSIRCAINARFIMNNDLSRITPETDEADLPYLIWYPSWADPSTYEELVRRKPSMKPQAARACIVADCQESYQQIQATPDFFLIDEARVSPNPYYIEDLLRKAAEIHLDICTPPYHDGWKRHLTRKYAQDHRSTTIPVTTSLLHWVSFEQEYVYNGVGADMSAIELFVSVPDSMRPTEQFPTIDLRYMYLEACRPSEYAGRGRPTRGRGRGRGSGHLSGRRSP